MKRFISVLLIVVMSLSLSFSSLGAVASSSDAIRVASSSNAVKFQSSLLSDLGISLYQSSDLEYGAGKDWWYSAWYSDGSGNLSARYLEQQSDGSYSASAPGTYDFGEFRITINKTALPSSGSYGFSLTIDQGHVDYDVATCQVQFDMGKDNVQSAYLRSDVDTWSNTGSSYTVTANVDIPSNIYSISFIFYLSTYDHSVSLGPSDWAFTLYSNSGSSLAPDINNNTQDDIASGVGDIASGVGDLNSGISDVNDSLREIVQTISLQLEALWNQLYNYMHVPQLANDDKNTGLITDSIDTMGSDVVDSVDSAASDITSNADSNAQAIQDNADKNTDTITNGYDNSQMSNDADRLNDTFTEYENVESAITDEVTSYIDDYTIPDWTDLLDAPGIISAITFFGGYMQQIYNSMGSFSVQITVSLTLIFVLMLVGYHRFKI